MICYKGKTFCTFYRECKDGKTCDRALTKKVENQAEIWWGSDEAPISVYVDKPYCFMKVIN